MSKETELSDEQILEIALNHGVKVRTGKGAITLSRAVIAADRELRQQADPDLTQLLP